MLAHPHDCPAWEYSGHHLKPFLLPDRCKKVLISLRQGHVGDLVAAKNARSTHEYLFSDLTPPSSPYYAGHYRGEDFRCLRFYEVHILGDPRVGEPASTVFRTINIFTDIIDEGIAAIDAAMKYPDIHIPRWQKIYYLVTFSCRILVEFLRIHPFANGNGHIGRFLIWAILGNYGIWPKKWPLDDHPPYDQLLYDYRDGKCEALEQFVLRCVLGS